MDNTQKKILIVDDEPDILETLEELLDTFTVNTAVTFEEAVTCLKNNTYDVAILDIMGVKGFELLKISESKGFPTVMLTAHAVTPEALKRSMDMGAVSFIPKDRMIELRGLLEDVVQGGGKRLWWLSSLEKLGDYFDKRFGTDWKEKDQFFKDFVASLKKD